MKTLNLQTLNQFTFVNSSKQELESSIRSFDTLRGTNQQWSFDKRRVTTLCQVVANSCLEKGVKIHTTIENVVNTSNVGTTISVTLLIFSKHTEKGLERVLGVDLSYVNSEFLYKLFDVFILEQLLVQEQQAVRQTVVPEEPKKEEPKKEEPKKEDKPKTKAQKEEKEEAKAKRPYKKKT